MRFYSAPKYSDSTMCHGIPGTTIRALLGIAAPLRCHIESYNRTKTYE